MNWFDSHCHLKGFKDTGILEEVLSCAKSNLVNRMTAVGTSSEDWTLYKNLSKQYFGFIYYSVGLHPCYVNEGYQSEIDQLGNFLSKNNNPVAIGEIGLDYFHLPKDKAAAKKLVELQKRAFFQQAKLAVNHDLPVIIHSRNSFDDCIELLDKSKINWEKVLFHCFSEGDNQIKELNKRGGRASFTGILTYKKNEKLRQAFLEQGLENLILETDSPYLSPEPLRGKLNQPGFLPKIGDFISKTYSIPIDEIAKNSFQNTVTFYNIK